MSDPLAASVTALANLDDPLGASTFSDLTGKTMMAQTGIVPSATHSRYGTTAAVMPGSAALGYVDGAPVVAFGTGPFTLEVWLWCSVLPMGTDSVFTVFFAAPGTGPTDPRLTLLVYPGGGMQMAVGDRNAFVDLGEGLVNANTWTHLMLARDAAGVVSASVNGVSCANTLNAGSVDLSGWSLFTLGSSAPFGGPPGGLNGYLNGFRATAAQRYAGNFTPATTPYDLEAPPTPQGRQHTLALSLTRPLLAGRMAPVATLAPPTPRPALRFSQWTLLLNAAAPRIGAPWLALPVTAPVLRLAMASDRSHALALSATAPAGGLVLVAGRSMAVQLGAVSPQLLLSLAKGVTHAIALPAASPTLALARVESRIHQMVLATPPAALALRSAQAGRYDLVLNAPPPQLALVMLRQRLRHGFLMGPYAAMARHSLAAAGYVVLDGVPAALGAGVVTLDGDGHAPAELHTGASDYGDPYTKSAQVLWLDGDLGADAALTCRIDDRQTYQYTVPAHASQHTQRVTLGRGARGRRWQFVIAGQGGALRLRALEPMFGASSTRRSK
ncbi:LamG-like jellyroll fold domain-containing protein [Chitiniphilus eburneus]|uniref:LamG-like jellyroll fold domain-containing protein n=1 Tax=Chitiniphilus eburneus TaxID=2571148 RepID=UPI0035CFF37C